MAELIRSQASRVEGREFESQSSQFSDFQNCYLSQPNLTLTSTRIEDITRIDCSYTTHAQSPFSMHNSHTDPCVHTLFTHIYLCVRKLLTHRQTLVSIYSSHTESCVHTLLTYRRLCLQTSDIQSPVFIHYSEYSQTARCVHKLLTHRRLCL